MMSFFALRALYEATDGKMWKITVIGWIHLRQCSGYWTGVKCQGA